MYPRVKEFLDGEVEKGKTDGYVKTMFNRIRPIPELNPAISCRETSENV